MGSIHGKTPRGAADSSSSAATAIREGPPTLVQGAPTTPVEHVRLALALDPFDKAIANALPDRTKFTIRKFTAKPSDVIRQMALAVEELEKAPQPLDRFKGPMYECLPEGSPARTTNLPLIRLISRTTGYADIQLARDLAAGIPIAGAIPKSNALKGRARAVS